jgi:hypothetical protein
MKLPRRKLMALVAGLSSSRGKELKAAESFIRSFFL